MYTAEYSKEVLLGTTKLKRIHVIESQEMFKDPEQQKLKPKTSSA